MDATPDVRRAKRPKEAEGPRVERAGAVVRIRSYEAARQVLRERRRTTQAGFTAEFIPKGALRHHPILMSDGPLHDQQRSRVARFFAPTVVARRHTELMAASADSLVPDARAAGECLLDELALLHSVRVTAQVVGLTESPVGPMARRLVTFFNQPPFDLTRRDLGRTGRQWAQAAVNGLVPVVRFYVRDVRPAIRARRRTPRDDVISHLIAEGYTNADIAVECVTYGTAGMVTTREFICMAAWHLLEDRPPGEAGQKTLGTLFGKIPLAGVFQRNVGLVGKAGARQRRLAGLPRPGQGQDREAASQPLQGGTGLSCVHRRLALQIES